MLNGKNAIITGANQGLGVVIAKEFVKQGANIAICARNKEKLRLVIKELEQLKRNATQIVVGDAVDISDKETVDSFFEMTLKKLGGLDILVDNAGIHGPLGSIDVIDWEEWIQAVQINLIGTVYCMREAIKAYKKQGKGGKIINLSGGGATSPRPYFSSYAATKAAIVRVTETLAVECQEYGIDINAIAPGAMNTRLTDEVLQAGKKKVGEIDYKNALQQKENGGASLENVAKLVAYLASKESDGITGRIISAVWDDWSNLSSKKELLADSDIYTLRRIIPQDRGMNWDKESGSEKR